MLDRRIASNQSQHTINALRAKIQRLEVSRWFGCLNRNGLDEVLAGMSFDGLSLVYFDVDNLKQANDKWGKTESSARIAKAIKHRSSDVVLGQYFSGDEFLALVPSYCVSGFINRLQTGFRAVEMSATFVVADRVTAPIDALAETCDQFVTVLKSIGLKGRVGYL